MFPISAFLASCDNLWLTKRAAIEHGSVMLDQSLGFLAALRTLLDSWVRNEFAEEPVMRRCRDPITYARLD